ncbi:addiction module toxin RelE [Pseudomonas syringae pv. actinidiae]|uniref:type II toxin-antitoxin system RelE/ParE family toxin n=1 Tax=Pseudomonas syringae TaxID=317 RepID=UPI000BB56279|nr:type II toxin-antitoxin system RelE/ParE family toxin [Pseudomonas syringae]PBK49947.1 addiction module toxin RelE [Pseudomonas syringae pv. actinidiae]PBK50477.1 addiction module toxin RelE [Pseudomonas syringae pv. actinidiae]RJX61716.1 addiction module toxin RelE [Pseudomonas syringae pv. actinidiae]
MRFSGARSPDEVQDVFGFALSLAQEGSKHSQAKPMKGFSGAGVLEVVEDYDSDTYRAVYSVKFDAMVYVLHCFQKKSTSGIKTAKHDIELIKSRLKAVQAHVESNRR